MMTKHKKVKAALVALAVALLMVFVPELAEHEQGLTNVLHVLMTYIVGQGLADVGKYIGNGK
jgi:hypothetical protein